MLDKDNIITTSVSEAVEKIPTNKKDYRKCCFSAQLQYTYKEQTNIAIANSRNSCLPTRIHPVYLTKSLKKFYIKFTEKKVQ